MPLYRYTARDAKGQLIDGVVTANDRAGAIAQVELQRYIPIKVQPMAEEMARVPPQKSANTATSPAKTLVSEGVQAKARAGQAKAAASRSEAPPTNPQTLTLSHAQQYLFCEQLAHLLSAGMTLDESLGVLVKRLKHPRLRTLSQSLHQSLIDGRSLSQAMRDFPRIFSPLEVNMVSAGEASGSLPTILRRLTVHLSEVKALRDRVQQALLYPSFLVVIAFLLIVVFMQTMVPQLMSFFKDTGTALPTATRLIIDVNNAITRYWWLGVGLIFGGIVLFRMAVASQAGRMAWDRFKWHVPVFSRIPRFRFYTQFARTLGTLMENGVILLRALELLEDIAGNAYIRAQMQEIRAAVIDGANLSSAASARVGMFPEMFVDMMSVGEQTGKFAETMNLIADVYERELDKQVKVVSTLIPPMVMVFIAAIIGTVVYGILVAVFNLTGNIHRR